MIGRVSKDDGSNIPQWGWAKRNRHPTGAQTSWLENIAEVSAGHPVTRPAALNRLEIVVATAAPPECVRVRLGMAVGYRVG